MSAGISPEDHAYMVERGFGYSFGADGVATYQRDVNGVAQGLFLVCGSKKLSPCHWLAAAGSGAADGNAALVVRYAEGFTSPVTAFVTAEVRQWKPQ